MSDSRFTAGLARTWCQVRTKFWNFTLYLVLTNFIWILVLYTCSLCIYIYFEVYTMVRIFFPSHLLSSPFYLLSLLVVTQIRGHIAGSFPPLPTTVRALHFYREKISALSSLVDSRRIVLTHARGALSSWSFSFFFSNKFKISPRRDSNSRTNTSSIPGLPLVHRGDRVLYSGVYIKKRKRYQQSLKCIRKKYPLVELKMVLLCFVFPVVSFRSGSYSVYVLYCFVLLSIAREHNTSFFLFERSEFLIATCKKKKTDSLCVCSANLGFSVKSANRIRPKHGIPLSV